MMVKFGPTLPEATGVTYDVSHGGMFVQTIRIPNVGERLKVVLHLPDGNQVPVEGKVVRFRRSSEVVLSSLPSGFGLRVSQHSEEYDEFVASLSTEDSNPGAD